MTAAAAIEGIRQIDPEGSIGMFGAEEDPPYDRPPLSKALWKGKRLEDIWRKIDPRSVTTHFGCAIKEILPERKRVVDDRGGFFGYKKLLLATGSTPRRFPFEDDPIIYFRTLADYRRLRAFTAAGQKFAVIGGGFIGAEIAAALAVNGKKVIMLFPGISIGARIFPPQLSEFVSDYYRRKGVEIIAGESITASYVSGDQNVLRTTTDRQIVVDGVVAGIGVQPNVDLARSIDLEIEDGVVVDEFLRTNRPDIYAAGDVAAFYSTALQERRRVEHEDNANAMGRQAGRNMAGRSEPYRHLPFFYSDLFDLGYEAVGQVDTRLEMVEDWQRPNEEGVVYYLKNQRVRGVLLWNVWGHLDAARELIAQPGPFSRENLIGRIGAPAAAVKTAS
jgi:NADPH-dependent 2,4-dienoyl-CoA reductase/sulfur reductase-like enzyme